MKGKNYVILAGVTLALFSCGIPKSHFTNRYKSIDLSKIDTSVSNPEAYVKVFGNSYEIESSPSAKDITSLSERGQQALINGAFQSIKDPREIFSLLDNKISPGLSGDQLQDKTKIKKRVSLTVENVGYNEAGDRISKLSITLKLPEKDPREVRFLYWDKVATEYKEVDVGKVSFSSKNSASFTPEVAMTGAIQGKLGGSAAFEKALAEEINLKSRVIGLSGSLTENSATIIQEGIPIQPMGGNVILELTMEVMNSAETEYFQFSQLFDNAGNPNKFSDVKVNRVWVKHPTLREPIKVNLSYDFLYRDIVNGANTYTEADDEVIIRRGQKEITSAFELVTADDIKLNEWVIMTPKGEILSVSFSSGTQPSSLLFHRYTDASNFLKWLKETGNVKVAKGSLNSGYDLANKKPIPLIAGEIENLRVVYKRRGS